MGTVEAGREFIDPRIRRTRVLLHKALENLLKEKDFEKISVQEIADAATLNRVTFYDHYADKFALLESVVESRFNELLARRNVQFDGTCASALTGIILAVCDYLAGTPGIGNDRQRLMEPHLENAVIAEVRRVVLEGLKQHPGSQPVPVEMTATALSWAIYGAAKEWVRTPNRRPSEEIVNQLVLLVSPMLGH
ncbi:MAG TPA: TetR/AcrR family transcriptional regulator [Bryobacteraceae bacterium]|nr:TetR/AcrR family transcriptional regulator [Bryobacteraceae bacterium]